MTYQGTVPVGADVANDFVSILPTGYLVDRLDPLVERIGGQIMRGHPEFVFVVHIFADQPVVVLEGLDPACEPAQGQVVSGQTIMHQL